MGKKDEAPAPEKRVPDLKPGKYTDGHPLDEIQFLECKIILKPERFTSVKSFFDYGDKVAKTAEKYDVGFHTEKLGNRRVQIREVLFMDTKDYRLYNNAFILRRRIPYEDGFPIGDPEVVFKFRHPDMQKAAETDIRPKISGDFRIKFKCEALPLKDSIGGYRLLFSHNVEFGLSKVHQGDRTSWENIISVLPVLGSLSRGKDDRVELVSDVIVEEVLQDLGVLDFGKDMTAKANVALWRARGDHRPLVGEFAFQVKFKRRDELHEKAKKRCEEFFCALQNDTRDWVSVGTTKTGVVYHLKGNPPNAHE
jgi:hypothetical protein